MTDLEDTSAATLEKAVDVGRRAGLRYIYAGNLPGGVDDLELPPMEGCFTSGLTEMYTSGKNFLMKVVKVTAKGQVTIPADVRASLGIDEDTYLEVSEDGNEIRLRKIVPTRPLSGDDPIWNLIGAGESGHADVAEEHDRHLGCIS